MLKALLLSTVGLSVLSGCFLLNPDFQKASLKERAVLEAHMPKQCTLREPPNDTFPCPFDTNPYYSKEPQFIGCTKKMLNNILSPFEVDEVLLQAFIEDGGRDLGTFAFRLKNQADIPKVRQLVEKLTELQPNAKEELRLDGSLVFYLWNDLGDKGQCYPAFKKQLFKNRR